MRNFTLLRGPCNFLNLRISPWEVLFLFLLCSSSLSVLSSPCVSLSCSGRRLFLGVFPCLPPLARLQAAAAAAPRGLLPRGQAARVGMEAGGAGVRLGAGALERHGAGAGRARRRAARRGSRRRGRRWGAGAGSWRGRLGGVGAGAGRQRHAGARAGGEQERAQARGGGVSGRAGSTGATRPCVGGPGGGRRGPRRRRRRCGRASPGCGSGSRRRTE
jgi:hypothetical protein